MRKLLFSLLIIAQVLNAQASEPATELRIATAQEFDTLNKMISGMVMTLHLTALTNRTLTRPDDKMQWQPQLATEIPSLENKQAKIVKVDGKKKIKALWKIKENAKWGDGIPVTCRDFQFTLEVANNPMVPVTNKSAYDMVEKIEFDAKKPKDCTFTLSEARWDFFKMGEFVPLPAHLEGPVFEKFKNEKEGYSKNSLYTKNITNPGLFNGPYIVTDYKQGNLIIFEPNPHFYGNSPKIKKVIVRVISNTATIDANLRTQEVNMTMLGMTLDQLQDFEKVIQTKSLPYKISYKSSFNYEHLVLDHENEILKDVRVRRALAHATNREQINTAFFNGQQKPAMHFSPELDPWYSNDPSIPTYPYSLKKASALLDSAGWKSGSDGFRYKNGKKFSLNFTTTAGNKVRENIQAYLKEEWQKIGVELVIKNETPRSLFGETMKKRSYNGIVLMATVTMPEFTLSSFLLSKNIPSKSNSFTGANFSGWNQPKADLLIQQIDQEFNSTKRKALAQKLLKVYNEDVAAIPLYFRTEGSLVPQNLSGYFPTGHMFAETNSIENWELTK